MTPIQVSRLGVIRDPDSGYVTPTDGNPLSEPKASIYGKPQICRRLRDNGRIIFSFLDSLDWRCSIWKGLILITIETIVGKDLQFHRAVLRCYSLLTSDFKHGDETRDIDTGSCEAGLDITTVEIFVLTVFVDCNEAPL